MTGQSEEPALISAAIVEESSQSKSTCPWGKLLIATGLAGIVTFVIIDFLTNKHITHGFHIFLEWIEANLAAGVFAFILHGSLFHCNDFLRPCKFVNIR